MLEIPLKEASHVHTVFIIYLFLKFLSSFFIKDFAADNIAHLRFSHFKLQATSSIRNSVIHTQGT